MKNKIKLLSLACLMSFVTLCSCSNKNSSSSSQNKPASSEVISISRDVDYSRDVPILNEDSIQIHYQRQDGKYKKWALWLWQKNADGDQFAFNYQDDFGVIASIPLSSIGNDVVNNGLGFIIKAGAKGEWLGKDVENDRFVNFEELEKDENGVYHIYLFQEDAQVYVSKDKKMIEEITSCSFMQEGNRFKIFAFANSIISHYKIYKDGQLVVDKDHNGRGIHEFIDDGKEPDINSEYKVEVTFKESKNVKVAYPSTDIVYSLDSFNQKYNYEGELGAIYSQSETTFKVWSPISSKIKVRIYSSGTPKAINATLGDDTYEEFEMSKSSKGVFEYTKLGDLEGKYYTYVVYNKANTQGTEIVDPYAKSCGINGLRGMIVDFSKTNPNGWDNMDIHPYDNKELVVYETHVADVTSSSSWNGSSDNKKKYLGLIEENTRYNETIKTGFDHIVDLGVNAVQLLPIFDQKNDEVNVEFNWGYNPENYNCLEGSYSSNPYDGYTRIREFKQVVQKYNSKGINIIMDVVYNHVNGAKGSNFDVLMPGYYFRYTSDGKLTNGSGCGNETASERPMVRKFIKDSTEFLASEYKLGGFRFDLMGLHDVTTMNEVASNLKTNVNQHITIYGEPWTGGTSGISQGVRPATQANANDLVGVGQFNDQMRDALIKGGLSAAADKGWITSTGAPASGDIRKIMAGLQGITSGTTTISDPNKTVNYVTCHDNFTLRDRIEAAGITDIEVTKKMAMLANSVVFTSQGTTFMLAGEEMFRTKQGNSNSYNASYEVNELDYSLLADASINAMNENYKKLIAFKKDVASLHLNKDDVSSNMELQSLDEGATLKYVLQDTNKEYVVLHTNGAKDITHSSIDLTGYTLMLDTSNSLTGTLGVITPSSYQTIIAYKNK